MAKDDGRKIEHRRKNYVEKYRLLAAHHRASRRTRMCYSVVSVAAFATVSPLEDCTYGGFQHGRSTAAGGARSVEKTCERRAPNRLLVAQSGESASQAKVFKAHAVPQGLRENLINALNVLANQQKRWSDSPIQFFP